MKSQCHLTQVCNTIFESQIYYKIHRNNEHQKYQIIFKYFDCRCLRPVQINALVHSTVRLDPELQNLYQICKEWYLGGRVNNRR